MTTSKAPRAIISQRIEKDQHYRYCRGHAYGYKGGPKPSKPRQPAKWIYFQRGNGRWVIRGRNRSVTYYYRAVMAAHLGRELRPEEVVHHINGDRADDRIENLELVENQSAHNALHASESRERIKALHDAQTRPDEYYLNALREWTDRHGRPPKRREMDADPDMPDSSTVRRRFGSYKRAVELALA